MFGRTEWSFRTSRAARFPTSYGIDNLRVAILGIMENGSSGIFISDHSAEKSLALKLQAYLTECFGESTPVFVSSDRDSIGGGRVWFDHIRKSLKTAKVVLVLLSTASKSQDWILFEAGVGDGPEPVRASFQ